FMDIGGGCFCIRRNFYIHAGGCIRNWEEMNTMVRYYDKSLGLSFPIMDSSWTKLLMKAGQHVK
ncbi:hypothetical protein, partial [Paenibacillus graminis]|uniref:hypothetical protein n=1 Tax=Paenibacillus graminis TaxID=189425 RepID=UPI0004700409